MAIELIKVGLTDNFTMACHEALIMKYGLCLNYFYFVVSFACTCRGRRTSMMHFDEGVGGVSDGSRIPFFVADITLLIPNVVSMQ